jgi:hypothetical protein
MADWGDAVIRNHRHTSAVLNGVTTNDQPARSLLNALMETKEQQT